MALELRPNCEGCDRDLAPDAPALICSYECTFCPDCVARLENVCPNCGGGFALRPVRPAQEWRPGLSLAKRPAGMTRHHMAFSWEELAPHIARLRGIAPEER
jgi:hypothetical protein